MSKTSGWFSVCTHIGALSAVLLLGACRAGDTAANDEPLSKVTPARTSSPASWALFDRSLTSTFAPNAEPLRLTLDRAAQLSAVKVFGPAPYRLRVRGAEGSSLGFATIDLSKATHGWRAYPTSSIVSTEAVEITFEGVGDAPGTIPELELWGLDDSGGSDSLTASPEDLASHLVAIRPDTRSAELFPELGAQAGTTNCATFTFEITRSPATFRRAHLVFAADGIAAPFALTRTVNGLAERAGAWLAGDRAETFADELDPELLHLGSNEVRLCVPRDASRGVALSDLRLVAEMDTGTRLASSIEHVHADTAADAPILRDRDVKTALDVE